MARSSTAITPQVATSVKSDGKSALASKIARVRARKTSAAKETPAATETVPESKATTVGNVSYNTKSTPSLAKNDEEFAAHMKANGRVSKGRDDLPAATVRAGTRGQEDQRGGTTLLGSMEKPFGSKEEAIEEAVAEAVPLI